MVLTLVATRKLRFVKRRPFGPLFGYKSRFCTFNGFKTPHARFTSRIDWLMQLNMTRRAQGHPGSNPGVSRFGPFWSTWRTLRRSILGPKRPRRSFPSAVKHLDSGSMTPSTVIRPSVVSVQVLEVADFAFCPIVAVVPPRSRTTKYGSLQERCSANMGPGPRSDNSKTAHFLHKCAQNRQKGVTCVRAESTIRVKAP